MSGSPTVSFVVPSYERAASLRSCLESIRRTVQVAHEIICVTVRDDAAAQAMLAGEAVTNVVDDERTGFVRAANRGFRAARGDFVVQLNDDCRLLPYTVENALHMRAAPAHRHAGQVAFFHSTPLDRNVERELTIDGVRYVVGHVRGLCYANFGLIARDLGEQLGWYDERFFMYGADPDLSLRVWHEAGLRVEPCAGALVEHNQIEDGRASFERGRQDEDNALLFAKWKLPVPGRSTVARAHARAAAASGSP